MAFGVWNDITEILPELYVCGFNAITQERVDDIGINLIINASKDIDNFVPEAGKKLKVIRVPVHDATSENLTPYFQAVTELIKANTKAGGKTIVHCLCGVSRSVSLCIAYLMATQKSQKKRLLKIGNSNMDFYEALDFVKSKRSIACPNKSFWDQLLVFDKKRRSASSGPLKDVEQEALKSIQDLTTKIKGQHKGQLCKTEENIRQSRDSITEILPELFVCGNSAITQVRIDNLGINLIINVSRDLPLFEPKADSELQVIRIPVHDHPYESLAPYFRPVSELIKINAQLGGKTVVHCMCGVSRSVSLCIAYMMTTQKSIKNKLLKIRNSNMGFNEALEIIKAKRSFVSPNPSFAKQLQEFEKNEGSLNEQELSDEGAETLKALDEITKKMKSSMKV